MSHEDGNELNCERLLNYDKFYDSHSKIKYKQVQDHLTIFTDYKERPSFRL